MLSQAIAHDRVGHAYLFTGPDRVGRSTLARTFAQALNCTAESEERPCGECRSCRLIAADRHPDVRVVAPEVSDRGTQSIKIDQIRSLQQDLSLSTYEARYKIAILKRFDAASIGAANAFLKTLEEPPTNVILMLTAWDADTLLPTITSRCRVVSLRPIPTPLIEEALMTRWNTPEKEANVLAHLADGRLGWAVRAWHDQALLQERTGYLDLLTGALETNRTGRFALADRLARKPDTLPALLHIWLGWWRDLALLKHNRRALGWLTNADQLDRLHEFSGRWTRPQVVRSLRQTRDALWQLEYNANTRLVLENLLLVYPQPA